MSDPSDLARRYPQWSLWRSDRGRWWATRLRPFSLAAEVIAQAYRTVDADDLITIARLIAEQEARAAIADYRHRT